MASGFCDRMGLNVAPLVLRLVLALVFIWAGLGKIQATMPVDSPEMAESLREIGVDVPELETWPTSVEEMPSVRRVHGLALSIKTAAHPPVRVSAEAGSEEGVDENGVATAPSAIWPKALAKGSMPKLLAISVVIVELAGGMLLLAGLLSRVWALSLGGVMLGAIWLTQIGPAVQAGGILPDYPAFDMAWTKLFFQLSLLGAALALALLGSGALSVDRLLVGRRQRAASSEYDDDDDD